ncbi:MAG: elongation factor P [Candidatus Dadabacteria bacterium]|nr:elongation factor P [Candidatus Dadabacteria bacterium]
MMGVVDTSRFSRGLKIEFEGSVWEVVDYQHSKMGRSGAIITTKLKNIFTGAAQEKKFRSGDTFQTPDLEKKQMQYLYKDDVAYYFMDNETYDQIGISPEQIGDSALYLKEQLDVIVNYYNGEPIGIDLPTTVDLEVTETDPGLKGDTVSATTKPATVETGAVVNVPLFIEIGEVIKVDTRDGSYVERVKNK